MCRSNGARKFIFRIFVTPDTGVIFFKKIMNKPEELIEKAKTLNLPQNDFAIFGSAHLYHCGLRDSIGDIDIIARKKAWEIATLLGKMENAKSGVGQVVELFNGDIEIFNDWPHGPWSIDDLIDTAIEIEGIKYVSLDNILKWKQKSNKEKDIADVVKIKEYLLNTVK